jgi:signal transduction histidine kinase
VNRVVTETIGLLSHSLEQDKRIRVRSRLARSLPLTTVSSDELKQVVLNLVTNAIQAIDGQGRVLICTRWRERDRRISLSISDTGRGIPKEVMPRIFDPFFTTKGNGAGTGLGLSVVYGIVTKYGGTITVHSREGKGTRVALALPAQGPEGQGEGR